MAIINNNVQNVKFLRNGSLYANHNTAYEALTGFTLTTEQDGTAILARYTSGDTVKTLVGFVYATDEKKTITIFDVEGASADVEALRQEINNKLGTGVTSANTATAQLAALSGTNTDSSATTSVWGAKAYADEKISNLDYTGVTTGDGVYVTNVTEVDGVVSATTASLPTVNDTAVNLKFVTEVDETLGAISVTRGEITSSNKTISLSANTDGGVDFKANVDGTTIIIDENTGTMSVASSALVQYEGDDDTIQIGAVSGGKRIVSSPLTIQKVTTGLSEEVKEEYRLIGHSGTTIGDPVKIYKDSHIVSINYITGSTDPHYQNLEYVYIDASGNTRTTYVDMSELVIEAEFASGVTVTGGVAHGVVDSTSESFLTVGADGFKLSGVQNAINSAVAALDADVSGNSTHVTVGVVEENGIITGVTVSESNIANADDLATLSGKTITAITSTNGSITASIDDAVGNKSVNIETDADKIKMSGFASTDALSSITTSDSVSDAFEKVDAVITENEQATSSALTAEITARKAVDGIDGSAYTATAGANYISNASSLNDADQKLDAAIKVVEGDLDVVETNYVSGMTVNGSGLTKTNRVLAVTVTPATSATTATGNEAITVETDANGNITLGLATIDCGTY